MTLDPAPVPGRRGADDPDQIDGLDSHALGRSRALGRIAAWVWDIEATDAERLLRIGDVLRSIGLEPADQPKP